jgi:peptidyl-prolyl cis-trans isomerase C
MVAVPRLICVAALALVALSAACNDKALETGATSADGGKHATGPLSPEQAGKVLAKVGDETITLGDFVAALEHMDQFDRLRYQSPERRKELLREMINVQLLADEARAKGYDKDPLTQQEIRSILRSAMMERAHAGAPSPNAIPESEVQAYYDAHKGEFHDPERRKISVIVLNDDANAPAVLEAAKRAPTAAKWGQIVREKSVDPAAKANAPLDLIGDYGWMTAPGEVSGENVKATPELREAAFHIAEKGQVYDKLVHVKDDPKVYVVRLTEITPAHARSLTEADRAIRVRLVQDKVREREQDLLSRLRAETPVQIDDAVLATIHVDLAGSSHEVFSDAGATAVHALMMDAAAAAHSAPAPGANPHSAPAPAANPHSASAPAANSHSAPAPAANPH